MIQQLIEIFDLPERAQIDKTVTKTFFLRKFNLNAAEKRSLDQVVLKMKWWATLKPANVSIQKFLNEKEEFIEIQFFQVQLKNNFAKEWPVVRDIFQKYIPYPSVLCLSDEFFWQLHTADLRINENDSEKRVVTDQQASPKMNKLYAKENDRLFRETLNFKKLDKTHLKSLYQDYQKSIDNFIIAEKSGRFPHRNYERTAEDLLKVAEIENLEYEISSLKHQIKKSQRFNEKVEMNIKLQKGKNKIAELKNELKQASNWGNE